MATYTKLANLKGPKGDKGDTGTFAAATAESVPDNASAEAIIGGSPSAATVHFKIPRGLRGLPGLNAVENDAAFAAYLEDADSETRSAFAKVSQPPLGVPVQQFMQEGEVFDTTGVEDMSPIIQRAISSTPASHRPVQILLPAGRIRLGSRLNIVQNRKGIGLKGAGMYQTTLVLGEDVLGAVYGYGDSNATPPTFLENVYISDLTVDCSNQVATPTTSLKAFNIGHLKNSRFENVRTLNSWATAFGIDFLVNVWFINCEAHNAGRGLHDETVLGSGSSFGIGVGAYEDESMYFINCRSYGAKRMGWNLEWLHEYGKPDYETKVFMNGCISKGDAVGVGDMGTNGVQMSSTLIEEFTAAGVVIGTGGQAMKGGRGGHIDASTVIRKGVAGGRPDQDVYGGHGIVVRGDDTAGGYSINAKVEDNEGCGMWFEPGFRLSAGGLRVGASFRRNGGGVRMYGAGDICRGVRFQGCTFEDNAGPDLDLRSAYRGLVVKDNTFFNDSGDTSPAIRFDPAMTLDSPTIIDNVAYDVATLVEGAANATAPRIEDNRELSGSSDPNLLYFRTLKTMTTNAGVSSGWFPVNAGVFTQTHTWERNRYGVAPVTTTPENGATMQYYVAGEADARFTAVYDAPVSGGSWRGIAIWVDEATGDAIVFRARGSEFYQVVRYTGGTNTTLWSGSTGGIPGNESHEMGLQGDPATGALHAYIDGIEVWNGSTSNTPTTRVGLFALASGNGYLYNAAIRRPVS